MGEDSQFWKRAFHLLTTFRSMDGREARWFLMLSRLINQSEVKMYMDRAEPNLHSAAIVIPQLRRADICGNFLKNTIPCRRERALILGQIKKKYGVLVREIREGNDISYLISGIVVHKGVEPRSFMVGRYTNEHMMRHFARYLNKGKLSRENINATIYEMKLLQTFCR